MSATYAEIERAREQRECFERQFIRLADDSSLGGLRPQQVVERGHGNKDYLVVDAVYPRDEPHKAEIFFYFQDCIGQIVMFSRMRDHLGVRDGRVIEKRDFGPGTTRVFRQGSGFEFSSRESYLRKLGLWVEARDREVDPYHS